MLIVVGGRSHSLLKQPNLKKRKYEKIKEIVASSNEDDIREAELISEVQLLKERINEYKMIQLEDSKYKEIVENLIEKGVINQNGDELIKFYPFSKRNLQKFMNQTSVLLNLYPQLTNICSCSTFKPNFTHYLIK